MVKKKTLDFLFFFAIHWGQSMSLFVASHFMEICPEAVIPHERIKHNLIKGQLKVAA